MTRAPLGPWSSTTRADCGLGERQDRRRRHERGQTHEDTDTVETVVYLVDSESTLYPQQFETDHVASEVVQFPSTNRASTLSKSLATAA